MRIYSIKRMGLALLITAVSITTLVWLLNLHFVATNSSVIITSSVLATFAGAPHGGDPWWVVYPSYSLIACTLLTYFGLIYLLLAIGEWLAKRRG